MSLFHSFARKLRHRRRHQTARQIVSTNVQTLEDRMLLTGNVNVELSGRDVSLTGDAGDNEIAIEQFNNWVIVRGLNGTTINGMNEYLISGLPYIQDDLLIQLGDGNDVVYFADGIHVGDDLRIDTGAGNDVVRLSNNRILDDLIIDTGTGDDTIVISNTDVLDDMGIFAGPGNNTVSVVDTRTADDMVLHTSNGNDTVTLLGATSGDRNEVNTFGGTNTNVVLPTNDGRMLPGMDVLNQYIAPDAMDDSYDGIVTELIVDGAGGVAANDFRSGIGGTTAITVVQMPEHGSLMLNMDGSFTYTLEENFAGVDSFTYQLMNSFGGFDIATVTLQTLAIPLTADPSQNHIVRSDGLEDSTSTLIVNTNKSPSFVIHGMTNPGATIEIDLDGDGMFDDATSVDAGADGLYMVAVTLDPGENEVMIRSTDPTTGRTATQSLHVYSALGEVVRFDTPFGSFDIELSDDPALKDTVDNFLSYLEEYKDSIIHSIVNGEAIQGGMFVINDDAAANISEIVTGDPVANQFDDTILKNDRGTLSVVLPDGDVDGATAAWSINLANRPDLDAAMATVFGRVIGPGMDVVEKIVMDVETFNLTGVLPGVDLPDVPLENYVEFQGTSPGIVDITAGTNTAIGTGTTFTTDLVPGAIVQINMQNYIVGAIVSDTEMTLLDDAGAAAVFDADIDDASVFFNIAPDASDYLTVSAVTNLFNSTAVYDQYNAFDAELVVTAAEGVLANDLSAIGDLDPVSGLPRATVAVVAGSEPSHGTLMLNPDGSFTYTKDPNDMFEGVDSFEYEITNIFGNKSTVLVEINTVEFGFTATADLAGGEVIESNDIFLTKTDTVDITGVTTAGATIEIDSDGDGEFDDGMAIANSEGVYTVTGVPLVHEVNHTNEDGVNHLEVRATLTGTGFHRSTMVDVHYAIGSVVRFQLPAGRVAAAQDFIDVELLDNDAGLTVDNFKTYFDDYVNSIIHRTVSGFIIQGGGFQFGGTGEPQIVEIPTPTTVDNEFMSVNSNIRGTLSMALPSNNLDGGTSEWFFNLNDNLHLDDDTRKHTVFGRVIGSGIDVADAIDAVPKVNLNGVFPPISALGVTPLQGYDQLTVPISGTVSVTAGTNIVTGVDTSFMDELQETIDSLNPNTQSIPGSLIRIGDSVFVVGEIISQTQFTLRSVNSPKDDANHSTGVSAGTAFVNGVPDPAEFIVFQSIDELLFT